MTALEEACHKFRFVPLSREGFYFGPPVHVNAHEHWKSVIPEAPATLMCILDCPSCPRNLSG